MAATEIIPQGISIALSIRELVRQAYLYSAGILVRPLVERAGMIRYLQCNPDAVQLWQSGWPRKRQPTLQDLLNVLHPGWQLSDHDVIRELMNKLVHSDPAGSTYNMLERSDGTLISSSGKIIDAPHFCDTVCAAGMCYLKDLTSTAIDIFPDAA